MKIKHFGLNGNYIPSKVETSIQEANRSSFLKQRRDEEITKARVELIAKGRRITDFIALLKTANYELTEAEIVKLAVEMYNAEVIAEGMKGIDFDHRASIVTYSEQ